MAELAQTSRAAVPGPAYQRAPLTLSLVLLGGGAAALVYTQNWRLGALFLIGGLLGLTLYAASFGFTAAYRRMILSRDAAGLYAQLLMLAVATVLFAPVLAEGEVFGWAVGGAVAPFGWQVAIGAFGFGLGMQLGGGCGSGTLFTVGGGNARMVVTLIAFCIGSFWASLHMGFWQGLPDAGRLSLGGQFGWRLAVLLQLGVLVVIGFVLWRWTGRSDGTWQRLWRDYWPLLVGAVVLAVLNFATLLIAGHPWTITWAFTLWGAKAATLLGWDPATSGFWLGGFQSRALAGPITRDVTSVMDVGIILGALAAASFAGRFVPSLKIPPRSLIAAVIGGLLMGYGARIAFGCNIGAFFSGVASTSLHGWLWIVCALAGTWIGVRVRPLFGLPR